MYDFLGDKLQRSVLGCTKDELRQAVSIFKDATIEALIIDVMDAFSMALFAPNAVTDDQIRKLDTDVRHILSELRGFK